MTDADGFEYYAYIRVYADDILIIMKDTKEAMAHIQESFIVKPYSNKEPKSYLGADINKYIITMHLMDGQWDMRHMPPMQ